MPSDYSSQTEDYTPLSDVSLPANLKRENNSVRVTANNTQMNVKEKTEERDYTLYSFLPVKNMKLAEYYQEHKSRIWYPSEIHFDANERVQWDNLEAPVRDYLKSVLFFFAQLDGIVIENLVDNFKGKTRHIKEAGWFYAVQEFMEVIHNETYSLTIDHFIRDEEEKQRGFNAIGNYPAIRRIADEAFRWMREEVPLLEQIVAFVCLEGILFSSAFASIYYIKRLNILKSLCKANEFIAKDESLHASFGVALYHHLVQTGECEALSQNRVHEIIKCFTEVGENFTREYLKLDYIQLNTDDMIQYIQTTADTIIDMFGYDKVYLVDNPFDWMAVISLPNKTNFFESEVTEYKISTKAEIVYDFDF